MKPGRASARDQLDPPPATDQRILRPVWHGEARERRGASAIALANAPTRPLTSGQHTREQRSRMPIFVIEGGRPQPLRACQRATPGRAAARAVHALTTGGSLGGCCLGAARAAARPLRPMGSGQPTTRGCDRRLVLAAPHQPRAVARPPGLRCDQADSQRSAGRPRPGQLTHLGRKRSGNGSEGQACDRLGGVTVGCLWATSTGLPEWLAPLTGRPLITAFSACPPPSAAAPSIEDERP